MTVRPRWFLVCMAGAVAAAIAIEAGAEEAGTVIPLPQAHSHNDYERARPLVDALEHGFCSVEADIHLVEGELLVAHDREACQPGRTLQALYLDPLKSRVEANGGTVYGRKAPFFLLIDIKSDSTETYAVLRTVLDQYKNILTEFREDETRPNAVTVILSGNRPTLTVARERVRYAAIDGRIGDAQAPAASPHLMPLMSNRWDAVFDWDGQSGPMPEPVRARLRQIVGQCHGNGQQVRFWGTPERPELWSELLDAGVDLINTDELERLGTFLLERRGRGN